MESAAHGHSTRFIPTHVGNTFQSILLVIMPPVHPHARGEHVIHLVSLVSVIGSSPRTWGTRYWQKVSAGHARFIPTHVGNTRRSLFSLRSFCGSSPRTWGTHGAVNVAVRILRFIPTHVGNTFVSDVTKGLTPVHPHARGEHAKSCNAGHSFGGSSPRTWGTHNRRILHFQQRRFIPTHVGNTSASWRW